MAKTKTTPVPPKVGRPTTSFSDNIRRSVRGAADGQAAGVDLSPVVGLTQDMVFARFDALNEDASHHASTDDICTPMACVKTMLDYVPDELWGRPGLKVLDPCCGNGNFGAYARFKTSPGHLYYNEPNQTRAAHCQRLLCLEPGRMATDNFLLDTRVGEFDLVMANPPYSGGGNKNQSLSNLFIEKAIDLLKDGGYLCFITPNNWMTYNQRNTTLPRLLGEGRFLVIDNDVKKHFPGVGSSFTIFVWQKGTSTGPTKVINGYLARDTQSVVLPRNLKFLPLYLSQGIVSLSQKLVSNKRNQFDYRCDLHNYTKRDELSDERSESFPYRTIHTARKTRYAKFKQDIYDKWTIIVPLSTYYVPYIETKTNVTQSVGYVSFGTEQQAQRFLRSMVKPEIKLMVHLTRYGNFNNIMLLRHLRFEGGYQLTEEEVREVTRLSSLVRY